MTESEIYTLYDLACHSADSVLRSHKALQNGRLDEKSETEFYRVAHDGFAAAQTEICNQLLALERDKDSDPVRIRTKLILRKIMDAVAWQLIGGQLYIARRLYREQAPPRISNSNIESVIRVAQWYREQHPAAFALISDLTSFVQIGDLLLRDPASGIGLVEVKEGSVNCKILEFSKILAHSPCEQVKTAFFREMGKKGLEQLGRMIRQESRMKFVKNILTQDAGVDPDSGLHHVIREEPVGLSSYDHRVSELMDIAKTKGWAIDVIDDCLFVGAYHGKCISKALLAFKGWLYQCGGEGSPMINLIECMDDPLGLPIFNRNLSSEHKFDVLFGRSKVLMGLHLDKFIEVSQKAGMPMRWSSRKKTARIPSINSSGIIKGKQVLVSGEGVDSVVGQGILARIFFHGITPRSAVEVLRKLSECRADPQQG